jgi:undecaprenyl diphosphate synthase
VKFGRKDAGSLVESAAPENSTAWSANVNEDTNGVLHAAVVNRNDGLHAAVIMDGNGRWANARGLPRLAGHRAGVETVRRVVEASPDLGISVLTLYAFSADNWRRPPREVSALMRLLGFYLEQETRRLLAQGVRLEAIGRRDRIPAGVAKQLVEAEQRTSGGRRLRLRVAIDYSSRYAMVQAAARAQQVNGEISEESIASELGPPVDLLIRTSGEQRLSDFLLWESAYAEIVFTERMWPDFTSEDLADAVKEFHGRSRRFGGIQAASRRSA